MIPAIIAKLQITVRAPRSWILWAIRKGVSQPFGEQSERTEDLQEDLFDGRRDEAMANDENAL